MYSLTMFMVYRVRSEELHDEVKTVPLLQFIGHSCETFLLLHSLSIKLEFLVNLTRSA